MARHHPFQIIGYHSCDREIGEKVLKGKECLTPSKNSWDWLGNGIYFWEQDPKRALDYGSEVAKGVQINKKKINTPFVLGTIIELGNCLNLVESRSLALLEEAFKGVTDTYAKLRKDLPVNEGNQRRLDCAVIKYLHKSNQDAGHPPYDTIRSAFDEGEKVYPNANFSTKNHIQVCVINPDMIKGYFLPLPVEEFNPYLNKEFIQSF